MSEPPSFSPDESDPTHLHRDGDGTATEGAAPPEGEKRDGVLQTVMYTDIENSASLTGTLGDRRYAKVLTRHMQLFHEALGQVRAVKIEHTGDGFMARFERPAEAVRVALRFQWLLRREAWEMPSPLRVRVGIDQGELLLMEPVGGGPETVGKTMGLAARVMSMGDGGQVLLTRAVFDEARQSITAIPGVPGDQQAALGWVAHGAYLVKGIEGAVDVFEVGETGCAPFRKPRNGPGAERSVSAEEEMTLGWRPAAGMEVPKRSGWQLLRPLGQGGFGEVWLAENRETGEKRVFKFCFDVVRLRSLVREVELFRVIQETLGPRPDIATLYDVQLERSPFFLESEYCQGGTLDEWLEKKMQHGDVPLPQRLALVADIARALAAAHSVGVIHRDVKPSNIFIEELADGKVQPRLADFGIGELTDHSEGGNHDAESTILMVTDQTHIGTLMYQAPEYTVGNHHSIAQYAIPRPSVLGDIYSLGVLLYQVVVADFHRPIGDGWRDDVKDELLEEDIKGCVAVKPELRLSSARLVAERLETLEQRRAELAANEAAAREKRELKERVQSQRRKTRIAAVVIAALGILAFVQVKHSHEIAVQREKERDQRYREEMIATIANINAWRGETGREMVDRYRNPSAGERDRRSGWEWQFAYQVLNPPHKFFQVSTQPLRALAVSPDEKSAAIAGDDGQVSIWSCDTFEKMDSWRTGPVRSLAWNGDVLAIGLESGEVVLQEIQAKHERARWEAHKGGVTTLAWNQATDRLTTGGPDGMIKSWHSDGTSAGQAFPTDSPVLALDWDDQGAKLGVVLGNPTRLWAGEPWIFEHRYALHTAESMIAWRPGANQMAISMKDMAMCSFDPIEGFPFLSLASHFSPGATAFAWAPDGERIAIGGVDGKIMIAAPGASNEKCPVLYGHRHRVNALHWLKRERLLSIGDDGMLRVWDDLRRPPHVRALDFSVPVTAAQWHPSENRLAVLVGGDEVQILNAEREVEWMRPMPLPNRGFLPLTQGGIGWSPDGNWLAAACRGCGVVAWRIDRDERFLPADCNDATAVQWLDDNRTLLVRKPNGWWRVSVTGDPAVRIADQHTVWIGDLGGERLAQVSMDGDRAHFKVADVAAHPSIDTVLPGEIGAVRACALNRDRSKLALGGESGAFLWLDTQTGIAIPVLTSFHSSAVEAIGWHPDDTRLVTASSDGMCRVFDVTQKAQTWMVEHQLAHVLGAAWNAGGQGLMLASAQSHVVQIYEAPQSSTATAATRIRSIFTAIEEHPGDQVGWHALAEELHRRDDESAGILRAAATLAGQARFAPLSSARLAGAPPVDSWEGVALTRAIRVAQACALERWDEVVTLSEGTASRNAALWFALARAEALAQLGRQKDSEAATLEAWRAMRQLQGAKDPASIAPLPEDGPSEVNLAPWPTAHPHDDWGVEDEMGSENNSFGQDNLGEMKAQPDGVEFHLGDFILLGGKKFRATGGLMLPRSTGWIPVKAGSRQIACLLGACNMFNDDTYTDTCIGSIFLLRADGGVVRVPLVCGQNIWRWWVSTESEHAPTESQVAAIAWTGTNRRAIHFNHTLALYRLDWMAKPDESPIIAISIASSMRQPAPLLMSVDARP